MEMIDMKKINPVYELEKKYIEQRYIVGKLDKEGNFETSERLMFEFMNGIYEEGKADAKKKPWGWFIGLFILGGITGAIGAVIAVINYIK
jgi:hypothetical protein